VNKQIIDTRDMINEVLNKSCPIGMVITDGIPEFKYNKQTTKMLDDLKEYLIFLIMTDYTGDCLTWQ